MDLEILSLRSLSFYIRKNLILKWGVKIVWLFYNGKRICRRKKFSNLIIDAILPFFQTF